MALRVPWNIYESAILFDGYLQILDGADRKKVEIAISSILRKNATEKGMEIDEKFRNVNGIHLQMECLINYCESIQSSFAGRTPWVFKRIVDLYQNHRDTYDLIINVARNMLSLDGKTFTQNTRKTGRPLNKDYLLETEKKRFNTMNMQNINIATDENIQKHEKDTGKKDLTTEGSTINQNWSEKYNQVLRNGFPDGMAPNSLRLDKFRLLFERAYGQILEVDNELLISQLKDCGTVIDERIYAKQTFDEIELIKKIYNIIAQTLIQGAKCIFIGCVLERWGTELADELHVYNVETLRDLLKENNTNGLVITETVIKMTRELVHPSRNVIAILKESPSGMGVSELKEQLWYLPVKEIQKALRTTHSIVNIDIDKYYYANNFPATESELQSLKKYISVAISDRGFLTARDLGDIIKKKCPAIAINTNGLKDWSYRNILSILFENDFDFIGSLVCAKGERIDMKSVYSQFCDSYEHLTLNEIKSFSEDMGTIIYWDSVISKMVRINDIEFVKRGRIHFDTVKIDTELDTMCQGKYVPIQDVTLFLNFPSVEYPWNSFLLESYLLESKKYRLLHAGYAQDRVCGAIVKRDAGIETYRDLLIDVLAHDEGWNSAAQAMNIIIQKGLQARKRINGFEKILQEAKLIREPSNQ